MKLDTMILIAGTISCIGSVVLLVTFDSNRTLKRTAACEAAGGVYVELNEGKFLCLSPEVVRYVE